MNQYSNVNAKSHIRTNHATVECATFVEEISNNDRVYFENIP